MHRILTRFAAAALVAGSALAHDFWLEPVTFRPEPGSILAVHVLVGHGDERTPFVRKDEHIRRFVLVGPRGERPLVGRPGDDPAGLVRLDQEGFLVVGYRSHPARVELDADRFEAYLREEGLEHVIDERAERGESRALGREAYSRCAKTLVRAGDGACDGFDRRLGFELEIVPEQDPTQLARAGAGGAPLVVRVLHAEVGLAGALVAAHCLDEPALAREVHSDAEGRARLELPREGRWLVAAVRMERAAADADHEWTSLWASLTFETRFGASGGSEGNGEGAR